MPGDQAFRVTAVVVAVLPNGTYNAELKNGHRLTAFVAGRAGGRQAGLKAGDTVKLQLTPYDLSVGRILREKTNDLENESSRVSKENV
jgi:translation initiation factor IF-1